MKKTMIIIFFVIVLLLYVFRVPIYDHFVIENQKRSGSYPKFVLTNNQYKEVTKIYGEGILWGASRVDIFRRGQIHKVYVNDDSKLTITSKSWNADPGILELAGVYNNGILLIDYGLIGSRVDVHDNGTLHINHGFIGASDIPDALIRSFDKSTVSMIRGRVRGTVEAFGMSEVNLLRGSHIHIRNLECYDNSTINIEDGIIGGKYRVAANSKELQRMAQRREELRKQRLNQPRTASRPFSSTEHAPRTPPVLDRSLNPEGDIRVFDSSIVNISNVSMNYGSNVVAYDSGTINISGGSFNNLSAHNKSTINISGGNVDQIGSHETSTVIISGGKIKGVYAHETGKIIFEGFDFRVTGDLKIIGDTLRGTGILGGRWPKGELFTLVITQNPETADLRIINIKQN